MINTLESPLGMWDPLYIIYFITLLLLVGITYWSLGGFHAKTGGEGGKPFLSGEDVLLYVRYARVEGEHALWGLREGLGKFFTTIKDMHSGILTDYVIWYIIATGIAFVIMLTTFMR
ncbi:MAG: hypothetical protein J7J27_06035 [Euryarchaeota archaeon]|nr:hypothetical protein [Euryarchaeota archaeon]